MMNWYKIAKDKKEFDFNKYHNQIWDEILSREKDRVVISFDLENNDSSEEIRRIEIGYNENFDRKIYALVQKYHAGGDWQSSVIYYRCQIVDGSSSPINLVYIPSKKEGNINLTLDDMRGRTDDTKKKKYVPVDSGSDRGKEDDSLLNKNLKKYLQKRLEIFNDQSGEISCQEKLNMWKYNFPE